MEDTTVGVIAFCAIFGGALLGVGLGRILPPEHLTAETRTAVSVSTAVVATLSALVISLLLNTASASFSAQATELNQIAADIVQVDGLLRRYGPEAADARATLRSFADGKAHQLRVRDPSSPSGRDRSIQALETLQDQIFALAPPTERHKWIHNEVIKLTTAITAARWLLAGQEQSTIPRAFLVMVVLWLALVFGSFGMFAPRNATSFVALGLCAMAVSGGITMILEMDSPFSGLVHVSLEPIAKAFEHIRR